jgi:hypothetical protein
MFAERPPPVRPSRRWPRTLLAALIVAVGALGTLVLVALVSWPPLVEVSTGATPEYPELQPQVLRYSPDLVVQRAAETVQGLTGWRLLATDTAARRIRAEAHAPVIGASEITVEVEPYGAGSLVHVRARLVSGSGDFGQNARHIQAFQASLAQSLSLARQVREP